MRRQLEGPAWIAFGIIISAWAYGTGIGSFKEPGVGFVAFASGLFIIAVGTLTTAFRRSEQAKAQTTPSARSGRFTESAIFRLTYTLGLLIFYALLLDCLGYIITTLVVLFGLLYDPVRPRWTGPLLASFLSVAVTYLVFEVWLKSQLPRGIFPWW